MCWCCGVIHDKEFVVCPSNCESSAKENIVQQLEREGQMDSGGVREERANK